MFWGSSADVHADGVAFWLQLGEHSIARGHMRHSEKFVCHYCCRSRSSEARTRMKSEKERLLVEQELIDARVQLMQTQRLLSRSSEALSSALALAKEREEAIGRLEARNRLLEEAARAAGVDVPPSDQ
eukprot:TRINITY_DN3401_c0_g1_i2.p3 TRINITY_DN3401_c0_g1~~TRINITY_DN3401_c0_g1_i2.p3  ORF type:complete len:128 (-),score=38.84 TRINITY_DN3401_c0_g1_i2:546-929(-)